MSFCWSNEDGKTYLGVESPLGEEVVFGFGGKEFFGQEDGKALCDKFSCDRALQLKQIHGNAIVTFQPEEIGSKRKGSLTTWQQEADGWFLPFESLLGSGQLFFIRTADCLPVFLISRESVFLIHAGWRGLQAQILVAGLEQAKELGHEVHQVVLGPAADPSRYEVGAEFCEYFDRETLLPADNEDKFHFDLYRAASQQLKEAGFKGSVLSSPVYTMTDDRFHSHRKDGAAAGRNLSFVAFPRRREAHYATSRNI